MLFQTAQIGWYDFLVLPALSTLQVRLFITLHRYLLCLPDTLLAIIALNIKCLPF
jgi:hypothetical protein